MLDATPPWGRACPARTPAPCAPHHVALFQCRCCNGDPHVAYSAGTVSDGPIPTDPPACTPPVLWAVAWGVCVMVWAAPAHRCCGRCIDWHPAVAALGVQRTECEPPPPQRCPTHCATDLPCHDRHIAVRRQPKTSVHGHQHGGHCSRTSAAGQCVCHAQHRMITRHGPWEGGGGGGSEGGGYGGFGWGPPSSEGPPMVPAEGGPEILKRKSSWHRRRRSKILAVSLKHWKGRRGGGGGQGGGGLPPPSSCGVRPFYYITALALPRVSEG